MSLQVANRGGVAASSMLQADASPAPKPTYAYVIAIDTEDKRSRWNAFCNKADEQWNYEEVRRNKKLTKIDLSQAGLGFASIKYGISDKRINPHVAFVAYKPFDGGSLDASLNIRNIIATVT